MADIELINQLKDQIQSMQGSSAQVGPTKSSARKPAKRPSSEKDYASADDALRKIVALVNVSDRSEATVRERLAQAQFEPSAIDEAVERAKVYGFIDDLRYAGVLIRSRLSQGKGIPGIERELRTHNIDIWDVPGWPDDYSVDDDSEFDRALSFLEKRPPRSKNLRDSAYRKLMSKGFSSSVASTAARAWVEQIERGNQ